MALWMDAGVLGPVALPARRLTTRQRVACRATMAAARAHQERTLAAWRTLYRQT